MSKHLSLLPTRPALPRVVAAPVPAQVGPLVRGLKKGTKRTTKESAESTVLKSAPAAGVDWSECARFGIGSSILLLYGVYIWCTSGPEGGLAIPTNIPSTSSPPSRPPPPASLDSLPATNDVANNPPPPPSPPQSLPLPRSPTSSAKAIAKKRRSRPLHNLLLGAVVSIALFTLTGERRIGSTRGGRGGGNRSDERHGGGGEGSGDRDGDEDDDGVGYTTVYDRRTRDNNESEDDHENVLYSALDSRDASRTITPTLSVSERLRQGSPSLVYDTSIWASDDARPRQRPDVTVSSPDRIADLHREGAETEDGSSIFICSLSTDITPSPREGGSVYATPISSTSSRGPSSPLSDEPGPSTLQFQFPSPPSLPVDSSGSSPLSIRTSSSSPFSLLSEFSPGSLDSLASPGVFVRSSVLGDVQSLNDRLRALPGARSSSGSSDGEDAERGSDYGSDGSWEDIGRAKG